jgi:hypothetical protein
MLLPIVREGKNDIGIEGKNDIGIHEIGGIQTRIRGTHWVPLYISSSALMHLCCCLVTIAVQL